jgi:hypothetical protein
MAASLSQFDSSLELSYRTRAQLSPPMEFITLLLFGMSFAPGPYDLLIRHFPVDRGRWIVIYVQRRTRLPGQLPVEISEQTTLSSVARL